MWLEIRRSRLDERDRQRVAAALAQPPILWEDDAPPDREGAASALGLGALLVGLSLLPSSYASVFALLGALALVYVARRAYVIARWPRLRWRSGRYLFPWGYAEVEADVLFVRRGEDLELAVIEHEGRPVALRVQPRGAPESAIELPLRRVSPRAPSLEHLHSGRFGAPGAGYRTGGALPPGRPIGVRWPELIGDAWTVVLAAPLVAALVLGFSRRPTPSTLAVASLPAREENATWHAIVPGIGAWPTDVRGAVDLGSCDASQSAVLELLTRLSGMAGAPRDILLAEVGPPDDAIAFLRARCAFRARIGWHGFAGPPHALVASWRMAGMMTAFGTELDLRDPAFRQCAREVRSVAPRDRIYVAALTVAQMALAHDHQVAALEAALSTPGAWPPCLDSIARSLVVETWEVPPE